MLKKIKKFFCDWDNQGLYIKWLAGFVKPFIGALCFVFLLNLLISIVAVVLSLIGKEMIDIATIGEKTIKNSVIMYIAVIIISEVLTSLNSIISMIVNEKFAFNIRKTVYDKVLHTNWLGITKYHTGDLMTRLTSDIGILAEGISSIIPAIIRLLIELIVTFFTLAYFEWRLAVVALLIAPVAAVCSAISAKKLKQLQIKVQETESRYRSFLQESLANILIVKTFCAEDYSVNRLSNLRDERIHWVLKKSIIGVIASCIMSFTFQLSYVIAFAWGAICVSEGSITFGTMTIFLTLVNRVQGPILNLSRYIPKLVSVVASMGRVMELQKLEEEVKDDENIKLDRIGVKITDVNFGYNDELVLEEANADIKPGEFVALIGESGIGKTTLIRLLMSFIKCNKGLIEFYDSNGVVEDISAAVRRFISYVPQGNTLFSGTIKENVIYGNKEATDEEVINALKMACAYDFVMELPNGMDTVIGEKGLGISEGQAQRIAIARALIKQSPFMILDEATSALDEKTELKVLEGIRNIIPTPTCLLITHRSSVLNYCDRQIRISDKKLEELSL